MKKLIVVITVCFTINSLKAQDLDGILLAADDASLLTQNYLNPAIVGLMYSMNSGWFTTGKVHKKFGFDLTIGGNLSFVPMSAQTFAFNPSDYEFVSLPNGETRIRTIMSEDDTDTRIDISIPDGDNRFKVASFDLPGGIAQDLPLNAVPAPTVQVGFGLPFKTDLKARFVPNLRIDDVEASSIGFGLQHDLTQYFGPMENLPLNISILGAFSNMKVTTDLSEEELNEDVSTSNGEAEFKMNTWTIQAIGSLDFVLVTVYGSVGYNSGQTTARMKGDYTLRYDVQDNNGNTIGSVEETITNPINLDFEASGMNATLGARLNLGFFKIFADYTFQEYNTASAGIAFSFR
jgi:hypothetical protein